ncbi:MAG: DUF928 domain-containing protein [Cyanobacteria bacterium P01_E01_bin.6]
MRFRPPSSTRSVHSRLQLIRISVLSVLLSASVVVPLFSASPAEAQSIWVRLFGRRRAEGQASGRANGGAVRDQLCSAESPGKSLVALVPQSNQGDTVDGHPSFFFYVPFSSSQNDQLVAEFMLLTEDRYYVLDEPLRVTLPEQPGIVRLDIPESLPELDVGERYNWYFSILCENWELSRNPFVSGWIERVSASESHEFENTWHEVLVSLTNADSGDRLAWASLLSLFDLEEFSETPVESLEPITP